MKILKFILPIILLVLSCKNEIEINGERDKRFIVYGILSNNEKRQFIRINRTFLTEGNVYDAAKIPDSTNFKNKLIVKVEEYDKQNRLVKTFLLDTLHIKRNSNVFSNGYDVVYFFDIDVPYEIKTYNPRTQDTIWLNSEHTYKLNIYNNTDRSEAIAETYVLRNLNIIKPSTAMQFIQFVSDNSANIELKSIPNGRLYEAKFIFYYREVDVNNPFDTITKSFTWNLGKIKSKRLSGNEDIVFTYTPSDFFNILKRNISVAANKMRFIGINKPIQCDVQLVISVAADEFSTYLDIYAPNNFMTQERPTFSNITNGLGIFSCRNILKLNYLLNDKTMHKLLNEEEFKSLNFQQ